MGKEPLYPHVPKSKKMTLEAALTAQQKAAGLYLVESGSTVELRHRQASLAVWTRVGVTVAEIRKEADKYVVPEFTEKISAPDRDLAKIVVRAMSVKQWTTIAEHVGEPYPTTEEWKFYLWYKLIGYK